MRLDPFSFARIQSSSAWCDFLLSDSDSQREAARDKQRQKLEWQLENFDSPTVAFDAQVEQQLRNSVGEWREVLVLGRQVAQARQIVTKLLAEKLVAGVLLGLSQALVSPRGLVDLYQVEIRGETRAAA